MNTKKLFSIVAGGMLLLAIPKLMPYGYFEILRWVVTGVCLYNSYEAYKSKRTGWMFFMLIIAVLFNPLYSFRFPKDVWIVIDFMVAMFLFNFPIISNNRDNHAKEPLSEESMLFWSRFFGCLAIILASWLLVSIVHTDDYGNNE